MIYKFEMPWPPSVGSCWRAINSKMILSKRARKYRGEAIARLIDLKLYNKNISESVSVELVLNPPTLARYDIDNFNKALFDALSHGKFWLDDEQVVKLIIHKGEKTKGGNVKIIVKLL
jgi:crossover junction endodeoxyribonuclease RusA